MNIRLPLEHGSDQRETSARAFRKICNFGFCGRHMEKTSLLLVSEISLLPILVDFEGFGYVRIPLEILPQMVEFFRSVRRLELML